MNRTTVLIILVFAQFACVSLWFAANAVMEDVVHAFSLQTSIGWLTSMVQFGFILGTLTYALFSFADRYSPSKVFLVSALLAASANASLLWISSSEISLYFFRLLTGFFLAGIYPTGMKIAADYFEKDISKALGYLLGALVMGTAFPYFLKGGFIHLPWQYVIIATSSLAIFGGAIIGFFLPDGPFRKANPIFQPAIIFSLFRQDKFRQVAFAYFGHMWELYAFWAFVPAAVLYYVGHTESDISQQAVMERSFIIIAVGSLACIAGGYVASRIGSRQVALFALVSSGACCLISPIILNGSSVFVFAFLLYWGMTVIMDSPQFSSLIAQYAPRENRGTALTLINCIGFSITIFSIQLLDSLSSILETRWIFLFLLPGPVFGIIALLSVKAEKTS